MPCRIMATPAAATLRLTYRTSMLAKDTRAHVAPTRRSRWYRRSGGWQLSGSENFETTTKSSNSIEVGRPLLYSIAQRFLSQNQRKEVSWLSGATTKNFGCCCNARSPLDPLVSFFSFFIFFACRASSVRHNTPTHTYTHTHTHSHRLDQKKFVENSWLTFRFASQLCSLRSRPPTTATLLRSPIVPSAPATCPRRTVASWSPGSVAPCTARARSPRRAVTSTRRALLAPDSPPTTTAAREPRLPCAATRRWRTSTVGRHRPKAHPARALRARNRPVRTRDPVPTAPPARSPTRRGAGASLTLPPPSSRAGPATRLPEARPARSRGPAGAPSRR